MNTKEMTREEWLAERRTGIGGSEGAAILGLSPWATPLDVYLDKKGESEDIEQTERMEAGNRMEPVIAEWYADREGKQIANVNKILTHPKYKFIRGNVDRRIVGEKKVLECKNVDGFIYHKADWGEEFTSDVPEYYFIQVNHYMLFPAFADGGDLAAVIGGNKLKVYRFEPDKEIADMLIEGYARFWDNFIKNIPPDPINLNDTKKRWQNAIGEAIEATPEIKAMVDKLSFYKKLEKRAKSRIDECKFAVENYMEENALLTYGGDKLATWKNQNTTRLNTNRIKEDGLYEKYAETKTIRVFR